MFKSRCHYCGNGPGNLIKADNGDYSYNGIDRLDSTKGYVAGNCVPCCGPCNKAKSNMTHDEFLGMVERIYAWVNRNESAVE